MHQQLSRLNIITNTCMGGFCHALLGIEPQNPFIWTAVFPKDFSYLIRHFNTINLRDIKTIIVKTPKPEDNIYGFTIDGKVKVFFAHHKKDVKALQPLYTSTCVYYYNIESYLATRWKARVAKMKTQMLLHAPKQYFVAVQTSFWTHSDVLRLASIKSANITFITSDKQYLSLKRNDFNVLYFPQAECSCVKKSNRVKQIECAKLFLNSIGIDTVYFKNIV